MKPYLSQIILGALFAAATLSASAQAPDSTEAMGQKFAEPKPAKALRVLLVGSGSSHDFPKYFLGTDAVTLKAAGGMDIAATPNLDEALALLPQADVLVFSGNHDQYGKEEFQKALNDFADKRKGIVLLHAATWDHPGWKGYNARFVGGKTPSHGKGEFEVTVKDTKHAVTKSVPPTFKINDENYRFEIGSKTKVDVCCYNAPDGGKDPLPSVWTVKDKKTRIVCITLGHDAAAHDNPAYKTLLVNSVNWVAGR
jgi:type 1 glutamine amidotransferase